MKIVKKYYIFAIIGILTVIFLIGTINRQEENIVFNPINSDEQIEEVKFIYVDIKGEVMNPGVYKVQEYTRLFQLIALAGGLTGDADTLTFNFSLKLRDEQVVYIPSVSEEYPMINENDDNILNELVNINRASVDQLDTLPGIGPATAQNIIDYRDENGYFESVEDLIEVPGIGEATLNEIREFVTT
ncbi:MAG: helix-hairpin-helix domain-containing protein [Candidatus Izimaplasma sp.]|nr:helix-hairpin-helix domain-containing protein [Candidatus Izimaplasma bacterium]